MKSMNYLIVIPSSIHLLSCIILEYLRPRFTNFDYNKSIILSITNLILY